MCDGNRSTSEVVPDIRSSCVITGSLPGRAPDAEVDAAGRERLQRGELLGHDERGVVRQHDSAGADPDAAGAGGRGGDEHRGSRRRDGRHVVVLGEPVAPVAERVGALRDGEGSGDRLGAGLRGAHRHEVEDGQGGRGCRGHR